MDFSRQSRVFDGVDSIVDSLRAQKSKGRMPAEAEVIKAKVPATGITADPGAGEDLQARTDIDMEKQGVYTGKRGMPTPPPPPQKPTASIEGGELVADASADRAAKVEKVRELMRNLGLDTSGLDGITSDEDAEKEALRRALEKTEA